MNCLVVLQNVLVDATVAVGTPALIEAGLVVPLQILGSGKWLARPPCHLKSWCQKKAPLPMWEVLEMRYTLPEVMQWILGHNRSEASGTCSKITVTSVGRGVERGVFSWMSHRSSSLFCATLAVGLLDQRVQDSGSAPVSRHTWQRDRTAMHCCKLCAFSCKLPHQRMHVFTRPLGDLRRSIKIRQVSTVGKLGCTSVQAE